MVFSEHFFNYLHQIIIVLFLPLITGILIIKQKYNPLPKKEEKKRGQEFLVYLFFPVE